MIRTFGTSLLPRVSQNYRLLIGNTPTAEKVEYVASLYRSGQAFYNPAACHQERAEIYIKELHIVLYRALPDSLPLVALHVKKPQNLIVVNNPETYHFETPLTPCGVKEHEIEKIILSLGIFGSGKFAVRSHGAELIEKIFRRSIPLVTLDPYLKMMFLRKELSNLNLK